MKDDDQKLPLPIVPGPDVTPEDYRAVYGSDIYHERVWPTLPGPTPLQVYEESVRRTMGAKERSDALAGYGLGVAGEAGEVADIVKKHLFHGHDLDEDHMKKELGDVLWYVTALALTLGTTLEEVMALNKTKLEARYPGGFSKEASRDRGDLLPYVPPCHPGEVLAQEFGVTVESWSDSEGVFGISPSDMAEILAGHGGLGPREARVLARELETTEQFWLGIQAHYDRRMADPLDKP